MTKQELRYLKLLSKTFPTRAEAATEIINLQAILNLPKGTEHFLADVHGEYEAFIHVLKNASGTIRRKIDDIFEGSLLKEERRKLCTLIYYPVEKLEIIRKTEENMNDWYMVTLNHLIKVLRKVTEKYTRSKVRKALPPQYSYIIQELLHEDGSNPTKSNYTAQIFRSILQTGRAEDFIVAICVTIQRMAIDHLHVVGDIYDRGPGPHIIIDTLMKRDNIDLQWGNHDMLWMGAALGNAASMATAIRISLRYANLDMIENGYGINILPLARFAMDVYKDDPCEIFKPKLSLADEAYDEKSVYLISQMHKAISIIQFKLEHQLISKYPDWQMADRDLLHRWDKEAGSITLPNGEVHPMLDNHLPTVDPADPYRLTREEEEVVERLMRGFRSSPKLKEHLEFFFSKGSLYLAYNGNLLYHASVPLNEDKTLKEVLIEGKRYKGKALYDKVDSIIRRAYFKSYGSDSQRLAADFMWYLWTGPDSPLFDKSAMTTFERYFIKDKKTHHEQKGYYYIYRSDKEVCEMILKDFGLEGPDTHIINGHVPVKVSKGEKPVMADGKMMLIDGGFSRAYQSTTGIAGYTLIYNSRGMQLVQHEPFSSTRQAIEEMEDIKSMTIINDATSHQMTVGDTDMGQELKMQVEDLTNLLKAYREGIIKERE